MIIINLKDKQQAFFLLVKKIEKSKMQKPNIIAFHSLLHLRFVFAVKRTFFLPKKHKIILNSLEQGYFSFIQN